MAAERSIPIGQKDVERAEALHGLGDHRLDLLLTRDIGSDRHCPPAPGRNLANHSRSFFARSQPGRMIHNDHCAQPRKLQCRCTSKPGGRSGNDCHLPREVTKIHITLPYQAGSRR